MLVDFGILTFQPLQILDVVLTILKFCSFFHNQEFCCCPLNIQKNKHETNAPAFVKDASIYLPTEEAMPP